MTCEFATLDAAYVLGSLSPAERADYERHLTTCDECGRSVRELAGVPGLLGRVAVDVLTAPDDRDPVPATLLPRLVTAARRQQRRRTTTAALVAAAAVAVIAGGSVAVATSLDDDGTSEAAPATSVQTTAAPLQLTPVGPGGSTGWVSLTPVAWGTRLDLTCEYVHPYSDDEWTYTVVIRTTDGRVEKVASWKAIPGRELHVTGATATGPDAIASVEVRDSDGDAILRLRQ